MFVRFAVTAGGVRLADPIQNIGRKALAVVADDDLERLVGPAPIDLDGFAGKVDGILYQVAKAIDDAGVAANDRLIALAAQLRYLDIDTEIAVGLDDLLDQRGDLQARHM